MSINILNPLIGISCLAVNFSGVPYVHVVGVAQKRALVDL